jgi:hypothetical protein
LCAHLLISISQTDGLTLLVPSLGQPDQQISHRDFFLWGYVKDYVYQTPMANINNLKNRTEAPIATVDAGMLPRIWTELEYHLDIVHMTNGAHVESV